MNGETAHLQYRPEERRALSDVILEAIDDQSDEDITRSDFQLYDDVDPDALDDLFRTQNTTDAVLEFDTGEVHVTVSFSETVDVRVTPLSDS